jgi:hypothetical protein
MYTGIIVGRCEVWAGNFDVNIGRTAMEVKLMITLAEIYIGKFGTKVRMIAMGVNCILIFGEMYWDNLVPT